MSLPSPKDISPRFGSAHEGNDERCAREHFAGKSLEEAENLFRQNALFYQEDLLWMGAAGFRYYVAAFVQYLRSEHSAGDPDAINCFASLLEQRAHNRACVVPVAKLLADACRDVLDNYDKFDADLAIYGDLRPRYEALRAAFQKLA